MQKLSFVIITTTLLQAEEGIPEEALGSIYTEALWFVGVITVMGIISFIVSSRNAKRYEEEMSAKRVQEEKRGIEVEETLPDNTTINRISELAVLRDKGLLKESEFSVLKRHLTAEGL